MSVATLATIVQYLNDGTGDPGLQFEGYENSVTRIVEIRESDAMDQWMILPIDVVAEDATYRACTLLITILPPVDGAPAVWAFLAVDALGEPCSFQAVQ